MQVKSETKNRRLPKIKGYFRIFGLYVSFQRIFLIFTIILALGFAFIELLYPPLTKYLLNRKALPEIIINSQIMEEYSGNARLITQSGELIYKGKIENGTITGKGKLYENGVLIYDGVFSDGKYEGEGTLYSNDGAVVYTGSFSKNLFSGNGELYIDSETRIEGEFSEGMLDGWGKQYILDELVYEGEFSDSEYNGNGKLYSNGTLIYDGVFSEGVYDGEGREFNINSGELIYEGGYAQGVYSGEGKLYLNGNLKYDGSFANGMYEGDGKLYIKDWLRYDGQWHSGKYEGSGRLYKGFSLLYEGEFSRGLYNGKGTEYYPETGYLKYEGTFYKGGYLPSGQSYDEQGRPLTNEPAFDLSQMGGMEFQDLSNLLFDKDIEFKEMEMDDTILLLAEDVGMIFRLSIDLKSQTPDALNAVYFCGLDTVADVLVGMPMKDILAVLKKPEKLLEKGLTPEETLALTISNSFWGNKVAPDDVGMMEFKVEGQKYTLCIYYEILTAENSENLDDLENTEDVGNIDDKPDLENPPEEENIMGNALMFKVNFKGEK